MALELIRINELDNVAVAAGAIPAGTRCAAGRTEVTALEEIPRAHKIALEDLAVGATVTKYGAPIGTAVRDIRAGEWVHVHNLETGLSGELDYVYEPIPSVRLDPAGPATFRGYLRPDGRAATRNEIWIVPTVGCMNGLAQRLAEWARASGEFGTVDGVYPLAHPFGCSQLGGDRERTQRLLAALVNHPNAGAVLVLSLGCEENNVPAFKEFIGDYDPERVCFMIAQEADDEVEEGRELLLSSLDHARRSTRAELPVSLLSVGLKCGASDAFSGVTANPVTGAAADLIVAGGGTAALTEVPEMFGAETELLNRAVSREVFGRGVGMINGFKRYFLDQGLPVYENPAPGNREGGITTLEEKSLGCIRKGGNAPVTDILEYGESVGRPGLSLVTAPGNDLVSITALAASGCTVLVFTTGRGNPLGSVIPTVKVSSTTLLAEKKPGWIDFDAGPALDGASIGELGVSLYEKIVEVASGELTNNERNGYRDLAIWKGGVTV